MSHFVEIDTDFWEQEYLLDAIRALGMNPVLDADVRGFMRQKVRAHIVVYRSNGYDIGFSRPSPTQPFRLVGDWWGVEGLDQDTFLRQLKQEYSIASTIAEARKAGFTQVSRSYDESTGLVRLEILEATQT